ncbi:MULTISPECIES: phage tail protein [unclassified Sedimentibacter]|uniref:phage tail protein n=1 Tax=unclassified Sedimentibacter TaxID=2649220 RepID=UPI0027DFC56C|nr:phage tail protein [Sedimentibacter sp. MB35-C1]WMJ78514.1 phage tail protein [Sedimentibacter sp. MB35-C1]
MPSEIKTENLGLNKWEGNEYPKRTDFVSDNEIIDEAIGKLESLKTENKSNLVAAVNEVREQNDNLTAYAVASGTNTYTATIVGITALTEGFSIKIKFTKANTGASTLNINSIGAKSILKGNGNALSSGNIKAGQICNLVYNGLNFQLLGEGGEYGTATVSEVLSGKTIGTDDGLVNGTMPNRGAVNQNLTAEAQEYTIPQGYHNGLGKIKAVITGLVASVIKAGVTVGGILGTFTNDATATAAQILKDKIAYVKGNKVVGTILSKGAQTYTPGTTNQVINAGQYLSGAQTIQGSANFIESNIKDGVNMWGKVGTLKQVKTYSPSDITVETPHYSDEIGATSFIETPATVLLSLMKKDTRYINYLTFDGNGSIFLKELSSNGKVIEVILPYVFTVSSTSTIFLIFNPYGNTFTIRDSNGNILNVQLFIN